ncbi:MFS transporter [Actinoplanes sp. URMC 104]|uniref:MFS transporter n=1 Tax=Actinoplanes sp. URMC 104 TaxID=3423409 RepID=UPI003F19EF66
MSADNELAPEANRTGGSAPARVILAVCLAQFLSVLDGFIVSVALPPTAADLGIDAASLQWIPNAYGLLYAAPLLIAGRMADRFGRTRMFQVGLAVLIAGSVLAALAPNPTVLFVGRGAQGLGTALCLPAGLGLLVAAFPEGPGRTRVLGLVTLSGGIGMVSAGALGGVLTAGFGWRAVFWFAVGPAVLAMALMAAGAPGRRPLPQRREPLNIGNGLVGALGLSLLVYASSRVPADGWSAQVWVAALGSAVLIATFVVLERRSRSPLLDPLVIARPRVRGANLLALIFPVGFIAPQFLGTQVLQEVLGLDAMRTGLSYLPLAAVVLATTPLAARLTDRAGPRLVTALGFGMLAVGLTYLTATLDSAYAIGFLPATLLAGAGVTAVFVALAVAAVEGVPTERTGMASGLFNTSQQVGGALVLTLTASLAAGRSEQMRVDGADPVSALASGLRLGMATTAVLSAVGVIGALFLLRRTKESP